MVLPHAEWGIVGFACFSEPEALKSWWRSQVWILLVIQWILFAPTMYLVGMGEEVSPQSCLPGTVNVDPPNAFGGDACDTPSTTACQESALLMYMCTLLTAGHVATLAAQL